MMTQVVIAIDRKFGGVDGKQASSKIDCRRDTPEKAQTPQSPIQLTATKNSDAVNSINRIRALSTPSTTAVVLLPHWVSFFVSKI